MEWMLGVLRDIAQKFKPEIISRVKNKLKHSEQNLELFEHVFARYYKKETQGRWYDPYHIAYSTLFATRLVILREASSLVVPSIILHDIGYYSPLVDKENWASKNSRIIHMQEGAGVAAELLTTVGVFMPNEVGAIVGMVASHDNGYLRIFTKDINRLALRDADRIWVMHPISFYKDWVSKQARGENLSLLDLFESRVTSFYSPEEVCPWRRSEAPDKEDLIQIAPSTDLAKKWRDMQFKERFNEIQGDIATNRDRFRKRLELNIEAALTNGQG